MLPADTRVYAYFDVPTTPVFTLNDSTAGQLDNTTYVLAGDIEQDITADVISVTTTRGRSRWLDEMTVGTASVVVRNRDRDYDPTGTGAYANNIVPGKRIRIDVGGEPIFNGFVDDWDLNYPLNGDATAVCIISDTLARLGRTIIDPYTTTSELSGARINDILDQPEVNFPGAQRDIDTGLTTLQADTIAAGQDALSYLQIVATTEAGRLFAARDGILTFRQRSAPTQTAQVEFRDDGTGVPFEAVETAVGSELLYNRAEVTPLGGSLITADNTESQSLYGIRTVSKPDLLFENTVDAESFAEYLVNKYGTPELRIASLTVSFAALNDTQAVQTATIEIGNVIRVRFQPPGGGDPIDQYGIVEGIQHLVLADNHRVRFQMSSLQELPFTLDDTVLGVLDGEAVLTY